MGIAMAGVAGYYARSPEIGLIEGLHHQNHSACCRLAGGLFGEDAPIALHFRFEMAIDAVIVSGCGNEPHRVHEFIHRDSLEHGNVFESLFRHELLCRRSLTMLPMQYSAATEQSPPWPRVRGDLDPSFIAYFLSSPPTPPRGRPCPETSAQ